MCLNDVSVKLGEAHLTVTVTVQDTETDKEEDKELKPDVKGETFYKHLDFALTLKGIRKGELRRLKT